MKVGSHLFNDLTRGAQRKSRPRNMLQWVGLLKGDSRFKY